MWAIRKSHLLLLVRSVKQQSSVSVHSLTPVVIRWTTEVQNFYRLITLMAQKQHR